MAEKNVKINDDTMITVKNNTGGGVSFRTDIGILRRWERPNSTLKIKLLELMQSISKTGVYNMFARGLLLIDEDNANEIMDILGIPELDEYVCTLDEIDELLKGVDYEDLRNVLKWGTKSQTETIISIAANKSIKDANVIKAIKDITGVDVTIEAPIEKEKEKRPARKKATDETVEEVEEVRPARAKSTTKKPAAKKTTTTTKKTE